MRIEVAHTSETVSFNCEPQREALRDIHGHGTNFTVAERELGEALERLDQNKIYNRSRSNLRPAIRVESGNV